MRPTQHPSNNRVLGAPAGWNQAELACNAIPITDLVIDGHPNVVSFWQPTPEELATLNAGGNVTLFVFGRNMPPVALAVEPKP